MMVLRVKPRVELPGNESVLVSDVADLYCDARQASAQSLALSVPREAGIWLVDAGSIMSAIYRAYPNEKIRVVGDTIGWITRRTDKFGNKHSRGAGRRNAFRSFLGGLLARLIGVSVLYAEPQKGTRGAVNGKNNGRSGVK